MSTVSTSSSRSEPTTATRPTRRTRWAFASALAYTWAMMILLGAIVLETVMIYPNIFADPPASLDLTMAFFSVTGPSDFFPPLGFASWVLGAAALVLCWRHRRVRWLLVLSLAMVVAEGVASITYFWPRNDIMFVEGSAVHSAETLVRTATEFETWHWRSRMAFNLISAVAAFLAFTAAHRRLVEEGGQSGPDVEKHRPGN
ncbi:hypothetical protein [Auraticoccus cholistanensis]|uniref:hypothetical protein n=1 Tax=Auraticoccus cholistanensis TaxID=2656650 RepID=UPI001E37CBF8|nr:hypothetical protein [Auraticoccus cholistanensis]